MQGSVRSSEWFVVGALSVLLSALVCVSQLQKQRKMILLSTLPAETVRLCSVKLSGAVQKPGIYEVSSGTRVRDVLRQGRIARYADIQGIDLDLPVDGFLEIAVPELEWISVRVEGAISNPGVFSLPKRARLCDLKAKIHYLSDADKTILRSRRLLQHGETVVILQQVGFTHR
ncbi:MAG: SLBB domain-containing protein [Chlamydiia bacterium]|nr:SLBB domain-containing protein [Chlamydiia bacterium]